jgi:hypothetical protein
MNGVYEDSRFVGYRDPTFNDVYLMTSNIWNWPVYTGVMLTGSTRTERLELIASYTRQFEHLEGTWQPNDIYSFLQPAAFANDKSGDRVRRRDHLVAVGGSYRGPMGLTLATQLNLQSGAWSGPVTFELAEPDPAFGPPTVTLPNGRVVSNPLAITTRFAYATRGEGQLRGQWVPEWNVRAGGEFRTGRLTWQPAVDILNILNTGRSAEIASADQSDDAFGTLAATRVPPRAVQVSVRARF